MLQHADLEDEVSGSHVGGCQNYGPFLGPSIIRHLVFRGLKKENIILITTHVCN